MKRLFLVIGFLLVCLIWLKAEDYQLLWKQGKFMNAIPYSKLDSISIENAGRKLFTIVIPRSVQTIHQKQQISNEGVTEIYVYADTITTESLDSMNYLQRVPLYLPTTINYQKL